MDLTTLISPEEATDRLRHYEAQRTEERTAEDDAIRAGYRAAARGLPVISLPEAIHAGGYFTDSGLPKIAIARANTEMCWLRSDTRRDECRWEYCDEQSPRARADVGRHRVVVRTPGPGPGSYNRPWWVRTIVPSIPPEHRPRQSRLWRFHVLWEVEQWTLVAPVDPALLRHIRGDLWAVVATWDLTPLEQAVLTARAGGR
ncbi:MAG TPA: hypothetical protein VFC00_12530 [Micromonosporaceae bacterium]|nr:hypothetical protein [Micromonosporaceae bacterium]